jgi:hypothetical protein
MTSPIGSPTGWNVGNGASGGFTNVASRYSAESMSRSSPTPAAPWTGGFGNGVTTTGGTVPGGLRTIRSGVSSVMMIPCSATS